MQFDLTLLNKVDAFGTVSNIRSFFASIVQSHSLDIGLILIRVILFAHRNLKKVRLVAKSK